MIGLTSYLLKKNDTAALESCLKGSNNLTNTMTTIIIEIAKGTFDISSLMKGIKDAADLV